MNKGPISQFIEKNFLHFNAAALVDAAKGYEAHLQGGGKMLVALAGAMSTAELGISLAEMIRQGKIDIISCTGANLEEDVMNSPYYWIQNGDMIYLNTRKKSLNGFGKDPLNTLTTGVTLLTTALSVYLLISRL